MQLRFFAKGQRHADGKGYYGKGLIPCRYRPGVFWLAKLIEIHDDRQRCRTWMWERWSKHRGQNKTPIFGGRKL